MGAYEEEYHSQMPYEIAFTKTLDARDSSIYINECCWGGDVVRDEFLPLLSDFEDLQTGQEDWGWFLWFRRGDLRLAIDIFCDDPQSGYFRARLTSRKKRLLVFDTIFDGQELETVQQRVSVHLSSWAKVVTIERVP